MYPFVSMYLDNYNLQCVVKILLDLYIHIGLPCYVIGEFLKILKHVNCVISYISYECSVKMSCV